MQQMYELTFENSLGPVKRTLLGNVQGFSVTGIGANVKPGSGRHVIMRGTSFVPTYGLWLICGILAGQTSNMNLVM